MNQSEYLQQINQFEAHYNYDSTYMRDMLELIPDAYSKFAAILPMAHHRERLSSEVHFVAKLAAYQGEDCGACLQLNVTMALEAGVSQEIVQAALNGGGKLPELLRDVYAYVTEVCANRIPDEDLQESIEANFDKADLLEMGLAIASARVFPTIKRTIGIAQSCSLIEVGV